MYVRGGYLPPLRWEATYQAGAQYERCSLDVSSPSLLCEMHNNTVLVTLKICNARMRRFVRMNGEPCTRCCMYNWEHPWARV